MFHRSAFATTGVMSMKQVQIAIKFIICVSSFGLCACSTSPVSPSEEITDTTVAVTQAPSIKTVSTLVQAARQFRDVDAPPTGSNVVLIVIDTLRADRLGSYGYSKNTSPHMDKIAAEGTSFHRFYAASPWTAPSFGTLFTGVSPSIHMGGQVMNYTDDKSDQTKTKRIRGLSLYPIVPQVKTLAELLTCCVDITAAIINNPFLHPVLGYDRGFREYKYNIESRPGTAVSDDAIQWLKAHAREQFMLLVHYMDPHHPYAPDEKYREEFFPMDAGRLKNPIEQKAKELRKMQLKPNELAFLRGLYDAQIREVDTQVGRVVDAMASLGLLDNTWLVITSDHGEAHFEHRSFFHGMQYEDEVTRVPLIIRAPGGMWGAGNQVAYSASHRDILPTILDWFGIEVPPVVTGKSLIPLMTGEEKADRDCYMEMSMMRDDPRSQLEQRYRKRALFDGRYKIIQSLDGVSTKLYDLDRDPPEQTPLPHTYPAYFKSVRRLYTFVSAQQRRIEKLDASGDVKTLPADVGESLKNLGYME